VAAEVTCELARQATEFSENDGTIVSSSRVGTIAPRSTEEVADNQQRRSLGTIMHDEADLTRAVNEQNKINKSPRAPRYVNGDVLYHYLKFIRHP
jgi:hypothetical protein